MNDTLPAAYQAIPAEVLYNMSVWAATLPAEERPGAYAAVNRMWRMRDPNVAKVVAQQAEKVAKKGAGR